ncbi:hypothetical protein [Paenibacillus sp. LK1]|uniref:hypothetical protein n=1 Tax=Paenibacillus sp. LK1 TaxID=2053014 RepID=UPI000C184D9B|nr:hypothetical protein [Paenibacillus sp. LK1]PIH59055.1 hypothetical protein CS562_14020 [Paenibacillus sp. LK1]
MNVPIWTLVVSSAGLLLTTINVTRQKKASLEIERIRIKREMKVAAYDRVSPSLFKLVGFVEMVISSALTRQDIKDAKQEFSNFREAYKSRKHLFNSMTTVNTFEILVGKVNSFFKFVEPYYHENKGQVVFIEEDEKNIIFPARDSLIHFESLLHQEVFEEIANPPRKWYRRLWMFLRPKGRR